MTRFLLLWIAGVSLLALVPAISTWAVAATTRMADVGLGLLGVYHEAQGPRLMTDHGGLRVIPDCTPTQTVLLLGAGILALPSNWLARATGWLVGGAVLIVLDVVRLMVLVDLEGRSPRTFEFVHVYLWQTFSFVALCAVMLAWWMWQGRAGTTSR